MNEELLAVLMTVLGYLLGAVPFGIVVSKALGLPDPRTAGSKNVGFTNVLRVSGKKPGSSRFLATWARDGHLPGLRCIGSPLNPTS